MLATKTTLSTLLVVWSLCSSHNVGATGASRTLSKGDSNCQQVEGEEAGKIVCACSESQCDQLKFRWPEERGQVSLIESSRAGKRFKVAEVGTRAEGNETTADQATVSVHLRDRHQTILGWGGAFTDATGINLASLSEPMADEILNSYYGEDGLQYNFGRVPIGGSDFSARTYSYDDSTDPDLSLKNWNLTEEDYKYKLPFIKRAIKLAKQWNEGIEAVKLFASPWSPPKWMKTNNNFVQGQLINDDKIMRSYANYLVKFYESYEKEGIRFWGATVQNEPLSAFNPGYFFTSLQFTTEQMIKFITKFLGPALEAHGFNKENFKLMVGDDNLGLINWQVPYLLQNKEVQRYVSGLAFHWYLSGAYVPYEALTQVYDLVRDKVEFSLMTEACTGWHPLEKKVDFGSWDRGEAYALDIMEDLLRDASGWIDWNMALNMEGGPNWASNFVDSPILVDRNKNEFYKQPMYYALAHFSRFFKSGSVRLETKIKGPNQASTWPISQRDLQAVSVVNEQTGHVVVNVLNKSNKRMKINLKINSSGSNSSLSSSSSESWSALRSESGHKLKPFMIDPKSINTVVYKL